MKNKLAKWIAAACMFVVSLGCLIGGAACAESGYELFGFTPAAERSVTQGDYVQIEKMHVFDSEQNYYDVKYKVTDQSGGLTELSGKGFFALEAEDYSIVYTVISVRGIYTKSTLVKVEPDGRNRFSVHVPETGAVNEPVEIAIDNSLLQTCSFTITVSFGGKTEQVEDRTFVPLQSGEYTVTVTAVSETETITRQYAVTVKEEMTEGTVEIFDESWANKRGGWKVETTADTGLKNRFGSDGSFLSLETDVEYVNGYVCPKMDKAYYEELAEKGYEYVSVWIYLDGELAHTVQMNRGLGNFYQSAERVLPRRWQELRYNLKDDPKYDYKGSFLKGFSYFASQSQSLFLVDNSDEYNGVNGGRERDEQGNIVPFKIYVDDIYAVKKGEEILIDRTADPGLKAGETFDLKNMIISEDREKLIYTVTYRGIQSVAENGEFTFTGNGEYLITASYGENTPNLYGSASFTLNAVSEYTASAEPLTVKKTGEGEPFDLSGFNFVLKDASGAAVPDVETNYFVWKNGKQISADGGKVRLDSAGRYAVEAELCYRLNGVDCKLYVQTDLDVWDEESKYTVFDFDGNSEYFADSYYMNKGWDVVPAPVIVADVHGKQGNFAKIEITNQQQPIFGVKPMYSLNYYRQLLADAERDGLGELTVSFDYFAEEKQNTPGTRRVGVFPTSANPQSVPCGQWNTVSFSLEDFVNGYYAEMTEGYEYLNALRGGENITIDASKGYAFLYFANWNMYATDLYIGAGRIGVKEALGRENWLQTVNGEKAAVDYTKGGYTEIFNPAMGQTYFQRDHNVWPRSFDSGIVTETVGGVSGTYAKITVSSDIDYDQTVSVYLPNTADIALLKEFAASGYVLKVKAFVDAPSQLRNAYTLEYDESASAFKTITESSRTMQIATGVWQEIEIDLNDYIRLCEQLGGRYDGQINNATMGVLGIQVNSPWTMYFGAPYLALPSADREVSVPAGGTVELSQYAPDDGADYEFYLEKDGVLEFAEGTTVPVGEGFRLVVVKAERYARKIESIVEFRPE